MRLCELILHASASLQESMHAVQDKTGNADQVREKVQSILHEVGNAIQDPLGPEENEAKEKMKVLFFETLASLSTEFFDRSIINRFQGLKKELISLCSYDLRSEGDESLLISRIEQEAKLALSLGVRPEKGTGVSGSYILKDLEGKKIAIFKPSLLSPGTKYNTTAISRIGRFIKILMGYHGIRRRRESLGEVFSYRASERLCFHVVPPTTLTHFPSAVLDPTLSLPNQLEGSLQMFIPGVKEAGDVLNRHEKCFLVAVFKTIFRLLKWLFTPSLLAQLEKGRPLEKASQEPNKEGLSKKLYAYFALFDFLTGQHDRHWGNWMINVEDMKNKSVYGVEVRSFLRTDEGGERCIVAIDNGACLPQATPKFLEDHNMYLHSELDIAGFSITDALDLEERTRISHELEGAADEFIALSLPIEFHEGIRDTVKESLLQGKKDPPGTCLPREKARYKKLLGQLSLLKSRIEVLRAFLLPPEKLKGHYTFKLLASLRQTSHYKRFLHASHLKNPFV